MNLLFPDGSNGRYGFIDNVIHLAIDDILIYFNGPGWDFWHRTTLITMSILQQ